MKVKDNNSFDSTFSQGRLENTPPAGNSNTPTVGNSMSKTDQMRNAGSIGCEMMSTKNNTTSQPYPVSKSQLSVLNDGEVKKNEDTQKFLSAIPARIRSLFGSIKKGFVDFGASISRFFSSLLPTKIKDNRFQAQNASISPNEKKKNDFLSQAQNASISPSEKKKNDFLSQVIDLSPEEKTGRMDAFISFFQRGEGMVFNEEGIFRVTPSTKERDELADTFLGKSFQNFDNSGIHEVASLFKNFLCALDLFGRDNNEVRESLKKIKGESSQDNNIKNLQEAVKYMSSEKKVFLKNFLIVCNEALEKVEKNKMEARNLSIVFTPNLLGIGDQFIIEQLITHRDKLWELLE